MNRSKFTIESLEQRQLLAIVADLSFANGGRLAFGDGFSLTTFGDSAIQSDGKILVAGTDRGVTGIDPGDFVVERYNPDGTLDETFGTSGRTTIDIGFDETEIAGIMGGNFRRVAEQVWK